MSLPRSFSILSLLLLTSVIALAMTVYFDRVTIQELEKKNEQLSDSMGAFEIKDPTQIQVRSLKKTHKMCWDFRIYVPPGESCTFNFGDGVVPEGMTHPPALCTRIIEGSTEQQVVSLQIRRVGSGREWGVNDIGGSGQAVCTDPQRFHWLSQVEEHTYLAGQPLMGLESQHGAVIQVDPQKEAVVWKQWETEYRAFDPDLGTPPRAFMAWIEPNKSNTTQQ